MKKCFVLIFLCIFLLAIAGCTPQEVQDPNATPVPTVEHESDILMTENISVDYPEIGVAEDKKQAVSQLVENQVAEWISSQFEADSQIRLTGSVTMKNDTYLWILFEGNAVPPQAAHPSNIAYVVCVCLNDMTVADPLSMVSIDDTFAENFRMQFLSETPSSKYSSEQWSQIVDFVNGHTTNDLISLISGSQLALTENGVIVCLNAPHAIGDYVKIIVKCSETNI